MSSVENRVNQFLSTHPNPAKAVAGIPEGRLPALVRPAAEIDNAIERLLGQGAEVHLLNTTIVPPGADGLWRVAEVDITYVVHILSWLGHSGAWGFLHSHIGHESTAQIAAELLRQKVEVDRRPWNGESIGVAIQLNGRPPEGKILSREEVEAVGYTLRLVFREPADTKPRHQEPATVAHVRTAHGDAIEAHVRLRQFAEVLRPIISLLRQNSQGLHDKLFAAYEDFVDRLPSGPAGA